MAHHVVSLKLAVVPEVDISTLNLQLGDSLSFVSPHGLVDVTFESPGVVSNPKFTDGGYPVELIAKGQLHFRCALRLNDGRVVGWPGTDAQYSGGGPVEVPSGQDRNP